MTSNTRNYSHAIFWLTILVVTAALFLFSESTTAPTASSSPTRPPITDSTEARSDTSVASRKISNDGQTDKGSIAIPFSPMIACSRVNDMVVDSRGTLWIATENGLNALNNGEMKEFSESKGTFPAPQAECLAYDGQKLWVGTLFGLFSMTRSGRVEKHTAISQPGGDFILDLNWDGISLWVGTHAGVAFMEKEDRFTLIDQQVSNGGLRNNWCQNIMRFSAWFVAAHDNGISFWNTGFKAANPEFWKNIDSGRSGIIRPINDMTFDGRHIWIATSRGVLYLTTPLEKLFSESVSNFVNYTTVHGLPDNRINAILAHRGAVWLGTGKGLARISEDKIQTIIPADGGSSPKILALAASGDILWLGTDRGVQFVNTAMVK